ncbi:unnamed protein product [Auanema sp. JU1783]|nr:unnamed protein product [Auanema sp. JU1783]
MQKEDDCVSNPSTSNTSNEDSTNDRRTDNSRSVDLKETPMSPEEARKLADEVIARLKEGKKPGELYDEYRPETQVAIAHSRRSKRNALHAIQDDTNESNTDERDDEGVRLATLAFFTLMALMGFMCTYLLVYVVEPMTRKEQEELMKQARAAGYDL